MLQTFIQNMLPKDGAAVYGKGVAGDMWKSLMAEKIADVMAERGGIGISDRILGDHYVGGKKRFRGPFPAGRKRPKPTARRCCPRHSSRKCSASSQSRLPKTRRAPARNPKSSAEKCDVAIRSLQS